MKCKKHRLVEQQIAKRLVTCAVLRDGEIASGSQEVTLYHSLGSRQGMTLKFLAMKTNLYSKDQDGTLPECEAHNISMINEMVRFAIILRKTSKEIYHDSKRLTLLEKSVRALELDAELMAWRKSLPAWLDLESSSLREPMWASKQKLVLQLSM
jgi:hypothetical protein